jgi:hypothetical protein
MLTELVKVLEDKKIVLETELAMLHERQAILRAELEKLDQETGDKEHQLASISEHSIKEYKVIWKTYTPPNPFPCPLCFVFHKKLSPLEPLSQVDDVGPVKCKICQAVFDIPIELLYA